MTPPRYMDPAEQTLMLFLMYPALGVVLRDRIGPGLGEVLSELALRDLIEPDGEFWRLTAKGAELAYRLLRDMADRVRLLRQPRQVPLWRELGNLCPCAYDGTRSHSYCEEGEGARLAGYPQTMLRAVRRRIARRVACALWLRRDIGAAGG